MSDLYRIIEREPTVEEFCKIYDGVGWSEYLNVEAVEMSLRNSLYQVVAEFEGEVVGIGRIVGDGAIFFYIQDVAVLPAHQHKGVGTQIMNQLMAYLKRNAPDKAFVGLFALGDTTGFYERYGFGAYPELIGMFRNTPI